MTTVSFKIHIHKPHIIANGNNLQWNASNDLYQESQLWVHSFYVLSTRKQASIVLMQRVKILPQNAQMQDKSIIFLLNLVGIVFKNPLNDRLRSRGETLVEWFKLCGRNPQITQKLFTPNIIRIDTDGIEKSASREERKNRPIESIHG